MRNGFHSNLVIKGFVKKKYNHVEALFFIVIAIKGIENKKRRASLKYEVN